VLELIPSLLEAEPSLRLTILANGRGRDLFRDRPWSDTVSIETPAGSRRGARALYELGPLGLTASRRFDVLHSPALTAPLATRAANVVVLADTTWISVPDMGTGQAATVRLWQAVVPHVARRADRVIAISQASARDVERYLGVRRDRLDVIPLGYEPAGRATPTVESELRAKLGLGAGPILLNVGAKKVHKNQMKLVEALPTVREAVPDAQLVLAGTSTPYERQLHDRAKALGVGAAVTSPGYVSEADLEGLYAGRGGESRRDPTKVQRLTVCLPTVMSKSSRQLKTASGVPDIRSSCSSATMPFTSSPPMSPRTCSSAPSTSTFSRSICDMPIRLARLGTVQVFTVIVP